MNWFVGLLGKSKTLDGTPEVVGGDDLRSDAVRVIDVAVPSRSHRNTSWFE
jgi:hypothetical protein